MRRNSPKAVYQITQEALELLRTYETDAWQISLDTYLATKETLLQRYAAERQMSRIPVTLPSGDKFLLSGGGQNILVKHIVDEFCSRFVPGGHIIHVGDTANKDVYFDRSALAALGVVVEEHGKFPDVLVYQPEKNWLFLIEAVTSHGPVDGQRHAELHTLFAACTAGLIYVTTFLDRPAMARWIGTIDWETEVWLASDPTHMIHFNGPRFLGPYT